MTPLAMTAGSVRAEWLKLWRRSATWVLGAILAGGVATLGYVVLYLALLFIRRTNWNPAGAQGPPPDVTPLRDGLLPANLVVQVLPLLAGLGGAIALILGALAVGGEYGWGTLKTILTQRPGRLAIFAGKALALGAMLLVFVAAAFAAGLLGSLVVAALEGASFAPPGPATILGGLGAAWLILAAWTALGAMLAALFRGTALAVGLGLVYALLLEGALGGVAALVAGLRPLGDALLGTNARALARAFGDRPEQPSQLVSRVAPGQAALVLVAYAAAFLLVAALVLRRRDVA